MKWLIIIIISSLALTAHAQTSVFADPAVGGLDVTDMADNTLDADNIPVNQIVKVVLPVLNLTQDNNIPPGTCKLQIGLGSKIVLDPAFDLATAALSEYFSWTSTTGSSGQILIIGTLVNELPADFIGNAEFRVKGQSFGGSTLTGQFLISNTNPSVTLSDYNAQNNSSSLAYSITSSALPVTFTEVKADKKGCTINMSWKIEDQVNVERYDVEAATDGRTYNVVATVPAKNVTEYAAQFTLGPALSGPSVSVRIKSVDTDGKTMYSKIASTSGLCTDQQLLSLFAYPNPVNSQDYVDIVARQGNFNGAYNVCIFAMSGSIVQVKKVELSNVRNFRLMVGHLAEGKYLIKVFTGDGRQSALVELEKH